MVVSIVTLILILAALAKPTVYYTTCRKKDILSLVGGDKYEVEVLTAEVFPLPYAKYVEQWIVYAGRHRAKGAQTWTGFIISYESYFCGNVLSITIPGVESI